MVNRAECERSDHKQEDGDHAGPDTQQLAVLLPERQAGDYGEQGRKGRAENEEVEVSTVSALRPCYIIASVSDSGESVK